MTSRDLRDRFAAARAFPLDPFQSRAADLLDEGKSVLVAAPTGSGKTLVAEYAIERAIAAGRRAFYTTPLKALSNQKYADLSRQHGEGSVGLLTGDASINAGASIVVMTTEVLRNMIYAASPSLAGLGCVVLDEVHFLADPYRGAVWEEVILAAPRDVVLVCLSATVSNAEELAGWIHTVRGSTGSVIEEERPIPLQSLYVLGDRSQSGLVVLPTFVEGAPNPAAKRIDAARDHLLARTGRPGRPGRRRDRDLRRTATEEAGAVARNRFYRPRRAELVEHLQAEGMLPAICFVFSRAGCDEAVRQCIESGVRLTSEPERNEIRRRIETFSRRLDPADLGVLGFGRFLAAAQAGVAAHHAGMVPPLREAVEACFEAALVKVVFATETLALGVNMPARTVVIEQLSKFSGAGHVDLTPGEYTQLTGRAGRRGIDEVGYGAVLWSTHHRFEEVAALAGSRSRALRSSFRPTYNMAVNLVRRYPRDAAYRIVRSSFAQYLSERPLTYELDAVLGVLEDRGYLKGWSVTETGAWLGSLYHERDLLLADTLRAGLLDGLDAASLAALVSVFVHEPRRASTSGDLVSARLARRYAELEQIAAGLNAAERAAGLPETRPVDAGFMRLAYDWAKGADLADLLAPPRPAARPPRRERLPAGDAPMTAGDFVRNVKQIVDLLRQLAGVMEGSRAGATARRAGEALLRGIVAASSGPGIEPDGAGDQADREAGDDGAGDDGAGEGSEMSSSRENHHFHPPVA